MSIVDFIQDLLSNPQLTNYIILVQFPIVFCLVIQSYQVFKIGLKEFKFITVAWIINLIYLIISIFLSKVSIDDEYKIFLSASFDLLSTYFFLLAVINSFEKEPFSKLKRIPKIYFIAIFIIAGLFTLKPYSSQILPYVHVRFLPRVLINFSVFFLLALFFKNLEKTVYQKRILYLVTITYAFLNFLPLLQNDKNGPSIIILNIDNIGFSLGLLLKIGILTSLSFLVVNIIRQSAIDEKDKLLHKLKFATNILTIKGHFSSNKKLIEQEDEILKSVLNECLNLLNENLGYYGIYDDKSQTIHIAFASKNYQKQVGYSFSGKEGITGMAIRQGNTIVISKISDKDEYFNSNNTPLSKDIKSAVAIPVMLEDSVLGVYIIESKFENNFTATDVRILEALVSQALTAITNSRLVKEIELEKKLLESLKQIDALLVTNFSDLKYLLEIVLKQSLELVNGDIGNISLLTNTNELHVVASTNPRDIGRIIDIDDSISGKAIRTIKKIYIPDIRYASKNFKILYKNNLGDNLICQLVIPLIVQEKVIAVFTTNTSIFAISS